MRTGRSTVYIATLGRLFRAEFSSALDTLQMMVMIYDVINYD